MISLPPSVRIYLCADVVDGRMGIDALSGMVSSAFGLDPLCGHLFVFFAARGRCARILFWDHNGFVLYSKRLERGRFSPPGEIPEGASHAVIEASELMLLLEGIDLRGAHKRPRWRVPTAPEAPAVQT